MKWITPLWSDPIGWSDWVAKTKLHVVIWTLVHIAFVSWGLFNIKNYGIAAGVSLIVFIGVIFPCMYLCAIHQLLKLANKNQGDEKSN